MSVLSVEKGPSRKPEKKQTLYQKITSVHLKPPQTIKVHRIFNIPLPSLKYNIQCNDIPINV